MENKGRRQIPIKFLVSRDDAETQAGEKNEPMTSDLEQIIEEVCESVAEKRSEPKRDQTLSGTPAQRAEEVVTEKIESAEVAALIEEKNTLYDRLLRLAAEFENYRKRVERERERWLEEARAEVLTEFLPIIDNFKRALESAKVLGNRESVLQGLDLIYNQFKAVLARFGVTALETIGQPFDPMFHEAVSVEPTDEYEENTIIDEYEQGYVMGDKLLRPARVKVATTLHR